MPEIRQHQPSKEPVYFGVRKNARPLNEETTDGRTIHLTPKELMAARLVAPHTTRESGLVETYLQENPHSPHAAELLAEVPKPQKIEIPSKNEQLSAELKKLEDTELKLLDSDLYMVHDKLRQIQQKFRDPKIRPIIIGSIKRLLADLVDPFVTRGEIKPLLPGIAHLNSDKLGEVIQQKLLELKRGSLVVAEEMTRRGFKTALNREFDRSVSSRFSTKRAAVSL